MRNEVNETYVLYASATVLLDLTANEECLETVANLMREHHLLEYSLIKLEQLIRLKPKDFQY